VNVNTDDSERHNFAENDTAARAGRSALATRRTVLSAMFALAVARGASAANAQRTLKAIHKRIGGRLGVHILDSQSGRRIAYDDDSRYAMASTFKVALAAALLWQTDHGAFPLTRAMEISKADSISNSPEIDARLKRGDTSMTVRELCGAAVAVSDNGAANLLLAGLGGPKAFTAFMRSIGDTVTRLDRNELELNSNQKGDERDTTTPRAMADSMLRIFTQEVLTIPARAMLIEWMTASRVGLDRVRAGIPRSWQSADKPGTGNNAAFNDLAIVWPPERRPIFIAVYMSESRLSPAELAAAHADIGRIVATEKWK
jgi:beta-lactamase class A